MNKKILIQIGVITLLALLLTNSCRAQVVLSEWITGTGTRGWDIVNDMSCDGVGNVYITGSYTDTLVKYKSANTSAITGRSMFIAKFDTNGKIIWNKNIQHGSAGFGGKMAKGENDEMIIVGGEEVPLSKTMATEGRAGFFISSWSSIGAINWTQHFTGSKFDYLTSLIVDTLRAEILVTGYFHDTLRVGEKILVSNGMADGIILRFDLNGNLKNARVIGGKSEDKLSCMTLDQTGNSYVAGSFQQKIQFDKNHILEVNNRREQGLFLSRYDPVGNFISAAQVASGKKVRVHSIASIDDKILVAGSFSDDIRIGTKILSSRGSDDVFLMCLDRELQVIWYKQLGGTKKDRPSEIVRMGTEIILSGSFSSIFRIDQKKLVPAGAGSDVFIVAFDMSGNLTWMRRTGGESDDYPTCMVAAPKEYIYLGGSFRQNFDMNGKSLQSVGDEDVFVGRLENCHLKAPLFKQPEFLCAGNLLHLDAGEGFIAYNWANGLGRERMYPIDQGGVYPLELVAANGCMIFDTVGVIEVPQPLINLGNDTTIADTSQIMLHTNGTFAHYVWNNGDTASENLIKGIELKEGPNTITVMGTNDQGCMGSDKMVITMVRTMPNQISELVSGSCVLYPNPTGDLVSVYFTLSFNSLVLTIHDIMGKELMIRDIPGYVKNTPIRFNLGSLPKGLYTLNIHTDHGFATRKIVLQ